MAKTKAEMIITAKDRASAVLGRFRRNFKSVNTTLRRSENRFKAINRLMSRSSGHIGKFADASLNAGKKLTAFATVPTALAGLGSLKVFSDFQKGMIGIAKTTNLAGADLQALGTDILNMSKRIPLTISQLAELGEAAGQMGVRGRKDIGAYIDTMAKLQFTTDVAGQDGARAIARILAITAEGTKALKPFADTLVYLGNNLEATESEIIGVANRIAGNTSRFKMGSQSILVLAGVMKALGKQSELAGSVTGKVFNAMNQGLLKGGEGLATLQALTGGKSKQQLKLDFKTKPLELLISVLKGLDKVNQSKTGNFTEVIKKLGLSGVRVEDIIGTLATSVTKLEDMKNRVEKGLGKSALNNEFGQFMKSLDADTKLAKNSLFRLANTIGKILEPAARSFLRHAVKVMDFLSEHKTAAKWVVALGAVTAILGPILLLTGSVIKTLLTIKALTIFLSATGGASGGGALASLFSAATLVRLTKIGAILAAIVISYKFLKNHIPTMQKFESHITSNISKRFTKARGKIKEAYNRRNDEQPKAPTASDKKRAIALWASQGSSLGSPAAPKTNPDKKQQAELLLKIQSSQGIQTTVIDKKGYDKISVTRGFQGAN